MERNGIRPAVSARASRLGSGVARKFLSGIMCDVKKNCLRRASVVLQRVQPARRDVRMPGAPDCCGVSRAAPSLRPCVRIVSAIPLAICCQSADALGSKLAVTARSVNGWNWPCFGKVESSLVQTSGRTQREIAGDLGIGLSTLVRWIGRSRDRRAVDPSAAASDVTAELKRLRRENEILRQERDVRSAISTAAQFLTGAAV